MTLVNMDGIEIGVFHSPRLKRAFLGVKKNNEIKKFATFDSELKALDFMNILFDFIGLEEDK